MVRIISRLLQRDGKEPFKVNVPILGYDVLGKQRVHDGKKRVKCACVTEATVGHGSGGGGVSHFHCRNRSLKKHEEKKKRFGAIIVGAA